MFSMLSDCDDCLQAPRCLYLVAVIVTVKYESPQRLLCCVIWSWYPAHYLLQSLFDAYPLQYAAQTIQDPFHPSLKLHDYHTDRHHQLSSSMHCVLLVAAQCHCSGQQCKVLVFELCC